MNETYINITDTETLAFLRGNGTDDFDNALGDGPAWIVFLVAILVIFCAGFWSVRYCINDKYR